MIFIIYDKTDIEHNIDLNLFTFTLLDRLSVQSNVKSKRLN